MKMTSIDFDYWYCGEGDDDGLHCGHCVSEADGIASNRRPTTFIARSIVTQEHVLRKIPSGTPIYVAESHASILQLIVDLKVDVNELEIWNVDHHSDDLDSILGRMSPIPGMLTDCATWASVIQDMGATYRWIVDYGEKGAYEFLPDDPNVVFVCKSTVCLHRTGDRPWHKFLRDLKDRAADSDLRFIGHRAEELRRRHLMHLWRRGVEVRGNGSTKSAEISGRHMQKAI
jgi:hypothetical protein